ncbi:putative TIM-barrel fold metal-dependent hydrolase [Agrobacterium tumefaciens]|uniref:TIM-barrel fold metal-dependent hydrolase n=1 Tax=Agrobacterium radiobacter TaxID=362 RepID=A0ABR6JCI4_AGRRD|nr:amidohydrolase family protein [Agrobacterium radiobacter]MBB4320475.1 putative TIM-barrel fold metal-dependent hydrolase [Agrobacterium radiobacter]MBB4337140.1 putative TIM-barrel fold metal-dependent hydrolase [Agrobacterium radiobacter]MBB4492612.1 putative TIM-barrel fold metal-dependent hydrolase [Agrobacterium radiobacter]MBB4497510.1 putative TIM-barrel fold metal-dependent hydrolase [Agrobacterium radiobacter]MBB4502579.1 putative TIM-barrel fold metal-dependent hydrolase [Agrobacte
MRSYNVISCDGHLEIPGEGWLARVPKKFQPLAPKLINLPEGGEAWLIEGYPLIHNGTNLAAGGAFKLTGASYWTENGDPAPGTGGPLQRLREQDLDGLDAELIYPPVFISRLIETMSDRSAYLAIVRAYNEWLVEEYCSLAPDRLIAVGVIPTTSIQDALSELERCHQLGMKAVTIGQFPNGSSQPNTADDAFWERAISYGIALTAHVAVGSPNHPMLLRSAAGKFDAPMVLMRSCVPAILPFMAETIASGVFDRFPTLQFYIAESNAGWVPEIMFLMNDNYTTFKSVIDFKFEKLPSQYVLDHFLFGIYKDPIALDLIEHLPLANIMWCSDFPHTVTTYPNSRQWLDRMFEKLMPEAHRKVLVENPCRFFGLQEDRSLTATPDY